MVFGAGWSVVAHPLSIVGQWGQGASSNDWILGSQTLLAG